MAEGSVFADELNRMLEVCSLSAEELVREVNRYGFPLPLRTFNYWLQGYFLPRSESAFQLVAILENICGVTDNRLSDALLEDLSSGASFVPGEFSQEEPTSDHSSKLLEGTRFSTTADSTVDWEANLIQKAVRDEVYLSADHTYARYRATVLARVPAAPNPTFFFQLLHEEGITKGGEEYFYDLSGIELKKQEISEENGMTVCAAQFALPDGVVPGDLYRFSYSWDEVSKKPMGRIGERLLPWTLDFYSCKVTFEGEISERTRYVTLEPSNDKEIEIPNDISVIRKANVLSMSMKNFGNVAGYFEVSPPIESGEK